MDNLNVKIILILVILMMNSKSQVLAKLYMKKMISKFKNIMENGQKIRRMAREYKNIQTKALMMEISKMMPLMVKEHLLTILRTKIQRN